MGKGNRKKHHIMSGPRKRPIKPDEYFRFGPLEMARFGEKIVMKNSMTSEQFNKMQDRLAGEFPDISKEIDEMIGKIADLVKILPPDKLLYRALWERAAHHVNIKSEIEIDEEGAISQRMIDYIQSVIVSVPPASSREKDVTEEKWLELKETVTKLFSLLNHQFMICQTAADRKTAGHDENFEEFYFKAQMFWCNIRGKRYTVHDIPFHRDLLAPHDEILKEIYGVGTDGIIEGLEKIQSALTHGMIKATADLHEFHRLVKPKLLEKLEKMGSSAEFVGNIGCGA